MRKLPSARKETRRARARAAPRDVSSLPAKDAKRESAARRATEAAKHPDLVASGWWYEAGYWWADDGSVLELGASKVQSKKDSPLGAAKVPLRTYEAVARIASGASSEVHASRGGVTVNIPSLRTMSEQNEREHWRTRAARTKHQKEVVSLALNTAHDAIRNLELPLVVTLTRVAPSNGLDSDNVVGSQKHVRDAVAKVIGVDDKSKMVEWQVQQKKGPWAVDIYIEERT